MPSVSPSTADAAVGRYPAETGGLDHLRAAVAGFTGLDAASPRTAEIASAVLAGLMTAMLIEGSPAAAQRRDTPHRPEAPHRPNAPHLRNATAPRLTLAPSATLPVDGQTCAVFAVDIVGFTRPDRDDDIRLYLHRQLYHYLQTAFDDAGVPWAECFCEDRGDGALVVIPPELSVKGVIGPLPERLRGLIRWHNHVSSAAAQMQLRAAVHVGPLEHDGHGFVGTDVNFAFRMLESRPLKRMLADSGAELGLVVSDYVYRGLVCRYPSLVYPGAFQPVRFQAKNVRAQAWTYLPGAATPVAIAK